MPADVSALDIAAASPAAMAHIATEGRWVTFEHLLKIDEYLLKVAAGEIDRLIIEAPVRHGKSELISHYFPAWWLGRKPNDKVMVLGYGDTFARDWGRKARDTLSEIGPRVFGVRVSASSAAADWWHIENRVGQMFSAGIGGQITGKGADLLIIDDPVKNAEEANSEVQRNKLWEWWQSTSSTRLQPGGRVVLVMARWHEDDLAGRLQAHSDPDHPWTILRLPALAEENDALGRMPGDALCPEMFDKAALERKKQEVGGYWFAALYQQKPSPAEGLIFKRADFRYWRVVAEENGKPSVIELQGAEDEPSRFVDLGSCVKFQTTDIAASDKTSSDYTVVSTWAATHAKELLLLDTKRQQFDALEVAQFLKRANKEHDGPPMWIETFGAGRTPHKELVRDGYPVRELKIEQGTKNDKIARAHAAYALYEAHKVFHPLEKAFLHDFEDELATFPSGKDDQVDTVSYAARLLPTVSAVQTVRQPKHATITGALGKMKF